MTDSRHGFASMLGTWATRGIVIDGGEDDGAVIMGTDTYEQLSDRFVVHHANVTFDGQLQRTIEVFTLTNDRFQATAYTSDGTIETVTGAFDDDGVYHAGNDTTRTTLHISHTSMSAQWERHLNGQWEAWIDMTFTRCTDS